ASSNPFLMTNSISSPSPPNTSSGSSNIFKSMSAKIQCGFQPVTIIGSSLSYFSSKSAIIADSELSCKSQSSSRSYSSIASSVEPIITAPRSIPVMVQSTESPTSSASLLPSAFESLFESPQAASTKIALTAKASSINLVEVIFFNMYVTSSKKLVL